MSDVECLKDDPSASLYTFKETVNMNGDASVYAFEQPSSNLKDSKVIVQVLPSVDLGGITALAELNSLSTFSNKSKNGSSKSEVQPSSSSGNWSSEGSNIDVEGMTDNVEIFDHKRISGNDQKCLPCDDKQASEHSIRKSVYFSKEMSDYIQRELKEEEIVKLKNEALETRPVVLLKRLNGNFTGKMKPKTKQKPSLEHEAFAESYVKPSFIHCGTGVHLRCIPEIVHNIQHARRRIVNLLHSLLYGRPGSDSINRQNILEFNGFTPSQKNFIARKMAYLKKLRVQELTQLCDVFSLRVKRGNKSIKIIKLLQFLSSPRAHKGRRKQTGVDAKSKNLGQRKTDLNDAKTASYKSNVKLRDFDTICSKVECATPESLSELNDLLFVKPCDNSEIHQKILDFSSFSFAANSIDFHYRKTLMHYMDMKTIRKIADQLDIEDWENCRSHQDLSNNILNFLMNMKHLDQKARSSSSQKNKRLKSRPNIMKLNSYYAFPKSRSSSPENFDSTYASEELNENELDLKKRSSYSNNVDSAFYHQRRKSVLLKEEQSLIDSIPLFELVQHPTDKELYQQIDKIISTTPFSMTLGDIIKEVFKCYSNFNLQYRIDFIRNKSLEILQELHESIVID